MEKDYYILMQEILIKEVCNLRQKLVQDKQFRIILIMLT